jgi:hypothetical protein
MKRIIMGVRYVEQGLLWLAGKGFQQKWTGKLFFKSEANFDKNSNNRLDENKVIDLIRQELDLRDYQKSISSKKYLHQIDEIEKGYLGNS